MMADPSMYNDAARNKEFLKIVSERYPVDDEPKIGQLKPESNVFDDPGVQAAFFPKPSAEQRARPTDLDWQDDGKVKESVDVKTKDVQASPFESPKKSALAPKSANIMSSNVRPSQPPFTPTQQRLLDKSRAEQEYHNPGLDYISQLRKQTDGYMNGVVDKFRSENPSLSESRRQRHHRQSSGTERVEPDFEVPSMEELGPFPQFDETPLPGWKNPDEPAPRSLEVAAARQPFTDAPHSSSRDSRAAFLPRTKYEPAQVPGNMPKTEAAAFEENPSRDEFQDAKLKTNGYYGATAFTDSHAATIVGATTAKTEDSNGVDEEARENKTHFKTWGSPAARNKPKSRVRTVIISGLPPTSDLTLVQSLIHGGAIETMRLIPSGPEKTTVVGHVTFTMADACDEYFARYPNGIDVRHQRKKYAVLVDKAKDVDVISGMMQDYLDCGASRVVRVFSADDEWTVVALNKIAEGKHQSRKVETVLDAYRNGERTITFRFANIGDAVKFKSYLHRSAEWEGCHIEFAEDPCQKATDIHYD